MAAPKSPMLSVEEARARILALAAPIGVEQVGLDAAGGRVLRCDLTAARTQPPFAASAMDGYAVRAAEARRGEVLRVVEEIAAGAHPSRALRPGETMRIFTGAPVPEGADAILLQEDARVGDDAGGPSIIVDETVAGGAWLRPAGGDFTEGETLLRAPRRLSPPDVALAAAMGRPWATVSRRPRVALLPFGDELRLPGEAVGPGQIVSSNNFGVGALVRARGGDPVHFPVSPDDLEATRAAIRAAAGFDLIVTLGGASDGDHDLSRPAFAAEGMSPDFYKIAMRPGKPLMAGRLDAAVVLGLPGNPVSAMVCAYLFVAPTLDALLGMTPSRPPLRARALAAPIEKNGPREHYMRARLVAPAQDSEAAMEHVAAVDSQDSSLLSRLASADVLIVRPPHDPARNAGDLVPCLDLDQHFGH